MWCVRTPANQTSNLNYFTPSRGTEHPNRKEMPSPGGQNCPYPWVCWHKDVVKGLLTQCAWHKHNNLDQSMARIKRKCSKEIPVTQSVSTTIAKYHNLGDLNSRNLFLTLLESGEFTMNGLTRWVSFWVLFSWPVGGCHLCVCPFVLSMHGGREWALVSFLKEC